MTSTDHDGRSSSDGAKIGSFSDFAFGAERRNQIKLHHLRYFVTAAEYGSFRQAGRALGIQESTISRRIRDLEDQLGASLFHRNASGVRLTIAGQKYLPQARTALQHIHAGAHDVAKRSRVISRSGSSPPSRPASCSICCAPSASAFTAFASISSMETPPNILPPCGNSS